MILAIENEGFVYAKDSPECVIYLTEHNDCVGCPTKIACDKLIKLMCVFMLPLVYEPKSFEDFQNVFNRSKELTKLILKAKTKEEMEKIPDV